MIELLRVIGVTKVNRMADKTIEQIGTVIELPISSDFLSTSTMAS